VIDCMNCGFESHLGRGYSSLVVVVGSVGSGLCDELLALSEESCRVSVCECGCVNECVRECEWVCVCVCECE